MKTMKEMKGNQFEFKLEKEKKTTETEKNGLKKIKTTYEISETKIKKSFNEVIKKLPDEKQGVIFFGYNENEKKVIGVFFPEYNLREEIKHVSKKSILDQVTKLNLQDWIYEPLRNEMFKTIKMIYLTSL